MKSKDKKVVSQLDHYLSSLKRDWGFVVVDKKTGRRATAPTLKQAYKKATKHNPKGDFMAVDRRSWKKLDQKS